jgi:predicted dinucleotide-binding enzyme
LRHQSTDSAGEAVARWAKGAKVIKALNTTGSGNMLNPRYGNEALSMFMCGDDTDAKKLVTGLIADLGFEPVDAGGLTQARYLEPLAMLWISMAYRYGTARTSASASCGDRQAEESSRPRRALYPRRAPPSQSMMAPVVKNAAPSSSAGRMH